VMWPKEVGTNSALEKIPVVGPAYERLLPSIFTGDSTARGWLLLAVLAAGSAGLVMACRSRRDSGNGI